MKLDPADVRAYMDKWAAIGRVKTESWLDARRRGGVAGAFRIADELRRYARSVRADWPSPAERQADLDTHARVADALRRVPRRRR